MTMPAHVLLLGNDEGLLEARAAVLRHFWQVAMSIPTGGHPHEELPLSQMDLVVLCHTIPEAQRQGWIDSARTALPGLLIVKMNGFDAGPHRGADATVATGGGPGALVSTIYGLLTERGLASRPWPSWEAALLEAAGGAVVQ